MPVAPASMVRTNRSCPGTSTTDSARPDGSSGAKPSSMEMPRAFSSGSRSVSTAGQRRNQRGLAVVDVAGGAERQRRGAALTVRLTRAAMSLVAERAAVEQQRAVRDAPDHRRVARAQARRQRVGAAARVERAAAQLGSSSTAARRRRPRATSSPAAPPRRRASRSARARSTLGGLAPACAAPGPRASAAAGRGRAAASPRAPPATACRSAARAPAGARCSASTASARADHDARPAVRPAACRPRSRPGRRRPRRISAPVGSSASPAVSSSAPEPRSSISGTLRAPARRAPRAGAAR